MSALTPDDIQAATARLAAAMAAVAALESRFEQLAQAFVTMAQRVSELERATRPGRDWTGGPR